MQFTVYPKCYCQGTLIHSIFLPLIYIFLSFVLLHHECEVLWSNGLVRRYEGFGGLGYFRSYYFCILGSKHHKTTHLSFITSTFTSYLLSFFRLLLFECKNGTIKRWSFLVFGGFMVLFLFICFYLIILFYFILLPCWYHKNPGLV